MPTEWNGKSYSLEIFGSNHHWKFCQIVEASLIIQFQTPDEDTRVGYLLDNIEHKDANLRSTIIQIRKN